MFYFYTEWKWRFFTLHDNNVFYSSIFEGRDPGFPFLGRTQFYIYTIIFSFIVHHMRKRSEHAYAYTTMEIQ